MATELNTIDAVNHLIEQNGYKSYLEVGTMGVNSVYNHIEVGHKEKRFSVLGSNKDNYDVIFINRMVNPVQSLDAANDALKKLSDKGVLLISQVLPENIKQTFNHHLGGAWRTAVTMENTYVCDFITVQHGMLIVYPDRKHDLPFEYDAKKYRDKDYLLRAYTFQKPDQEETSKKLEEMTESELKKELEKVTGKKPRGKFIRDNAIKKIKESNGIVADS